MTVKKTGEWKQASRQLQRMADRFPKVARVALRQEAELLRKNIIQGLTKQAPGGTTITPLSPLTLAARELKGRGGTKALLVRGDLRNNITTQVQGGHVFVGVSRKAQNSEGEPLVDIAHTQEFGAGPIIIPLTDPMRRFLFMLLRRAGAPRRPGTGKNVVIVNIPARPFLRPAFKTFSSGAQARLARRLFSLLNLGGR